MYHAVLSGVIEVIVVVVVILVVVEARRCWAHAVGRLPSTYLLTKIRFLEYTQVQYWKVVPE